MGWLARGADPVRKVRVEIGGDVLELSQASAAKQQRVVDLFVSPTRGSGSPRPVTATSSEYGRTRRDAVLAFLLAAVAVLASPRAVSSSGGRS